MSDPAARRGADGRPRHRLGLRHRARERQRSRNDALDGLRGLAVVGVLLFHDGRLTGGFLGVDLFFALSGFLITRLLVGEATTTGRIDGWRFWERRFRRLLPAVLVVLAVVPPLMAWFGTPAQVEDARNGTAPALLFVYNWHEIRTGEGYWALFTDPSPLTHLWSLAVEQQFYLVWPLLFFVAVRSRRWRPTVALVTVAGIVASTTLMWLLFDPLDPNRAYMGTDTRAASILCGALVAILGLPARAEGRFLSAPTSRTTVWVIEASQLALLGGIAWSWVVVDGAGSTRLSQGGYLLHAAAAALLAGSLALPRATIVGRGLALWPLRWAGLVSYGWYLWHWPAYVVLTEARVGTSGWPLTAARWSVSLALAFVSYVLVELPVRRRTLLPSTRSAAAAVAVMSALVVAIALAVPIPDTTPAAFDPGSVGGGSVSATEFSPPPSSTSTGPSTTTTPVARRDIDSVIWSGDSVALDISEGVIAALDAAGVQGSFAGYYGAGLVPRPGVDPEIVFVQPVLERRPDVVVFQFSVWDDLADDAAQRSAFDHYTDVVLGTGATLVFVQPPPNEPTADVPRAGVTMIEFARELSAARPDDVMVLDSDRLWGTAFVRDLRGDGIPDRKTDGVHLCAQGGAEFAAWLTAELATLFDGVTPAPPDQWATGPWTADPNFDVPKGACV